MQITHLLLPLAGLCLVLSSEVSADADRGRLLYENHCQVCHTSTVHVRDQRKVKDTAALRTMIRRWSDHLKLGWQDGERDDVYQYLNNRYYKFSSTAPERKPR